jgi:hypothetical protein
MHTDWNLVNLRSAKINSIFILLIYTFLPSDQSFSSQIETFFEDSPFYRKTDFQDWFPTQWFACFLNIFDHSWQFVILPLWWQSDVHCEPKSFVPHLETTNLFIILNPTHHVISWRMCHMMSHFLAKYIMTPVLTRRSMLVDPTSGRYVEWINRMLEHLTYQQKYEFLRNRF